MDDNVFREIDEELRRDRLLALWRRYGRFVVGGVVALVAVVAASIGWEGYSRQQALETGAHYYAAVELLRQGNEDAARAAFADLAEDGEEGYAAMAHLHQAALLSAKGDVDGAIHHYREISKDSDVPPAFRGLAQILGALRRIDREDPETLTAELEPLTEMGNPWRHSALEITALVAMRVGERNKALAIYTSLAADPGTPKKMRQRAVEMGALLGEGS